MFLSAAINSGTYFLVGPSNSKEVRIIAHNLNDQISFNADALKDEALSGSIETSKNHSWSNYIKGVLIEIIKRIDKNTPVSGFYALFGGDLGLGLGLSSSAALEVSSGLALSKYYKIELTPHELAKIGQKSEHTYVGVKCGLLDQISSLYGKEANLVKTDFRSLDVENVPLGSDLCFLICNTKVTHSLVTSEYNERRESCEGASNYFTNHVDQKVTHLRDVSWEQLHSHKDKMNKVHAKRAAHIVGENDRVLKGKQYLMDGQIQQFGQLMFESHDSSTHNFENSCKELDAIVDIAKSIEEVVGARLSGGGFGGAALLVVRSKDKDEVKKKIEHLYKEKIGSDCEITFVVPSSGARIVN